ncbi:MAG: RelA/SpoT family protein [Candidatus Falkowbacteria bacterium]|nr:RelA/SpoT family protein [Candidatus Falkowbacteria bacterium]
MTVERIIKKFNDNNPGVDSEILQLAYDFAEEAHRGQIRKSGEPYINHPLHVAYLLAEIKADLATVAAGILHDVPEDTSRTLDDLKNNFGVEIANLVRGITKLGKIKYRGLERYRENLKKMFLAMAVDIRVIFIKFCDRLHNMRTLDYLPEEKQQRIAKETLEIYAPIAGILGIWRLKWQLEDLCFKYLYPEDFNKLEYKYEVEKKAERNNFFNRIKKDLNPQLKEAEINNEIEVRFKHLYSIFQKMKTKDRTFDEINDVFALRVIVEDINDCYKVLGIIHTIWKPKPNRFKDYIAVPKPNGYRSLHTTVFGPEGKLVELQIRTREMHEESIYGLAAHWHYKAKRQENVQKQPAWIKEIIDIQKEFSDTNDFVHKIQLDVFHNRIFVLSPKGDAIELPDGATPIDYAYAIHTKVGNSAVRAIVNEKICRLDYELKNSDVVEIITEKNKIHPNKDWLKFAKTKKAKDAIKQYAKKSPFENIKKFIPGMGRK